jgi:multiple sugar transport system permease protein
VFRSQQRMDLFLNLLAGLIVVLVVVFAIFPLIWTFLTSLKLEEEIVTRTLQYLPRQITFQNYETLWRQSGFPTLVLNSVVVTSITGFICLTIGTLAAYSFSRYRFRGRGKLLIFYLVIRMFPVVLMIIPLFVMMRNLGLLDSRLGLALAYTTFLLPLCIWMLKGFFDAIPAELEDAARIDGCTRLGALLRVVLPLARSGLMTTAVFIAISAWNEFLFALMMTTSQGSRTWPVGLQLMVGEFQLPWGPLSAGGIISIVPIIIFFAIIQRSLIRGLTAGAVKG